ncbi:MAG: hypothetical protein ACLSAP_05685 [Oscillospiraceae bacterium]
MKRLLFETVDTVGKRMIFAAARENQPVARMLLPFRLRADVQAGAPGRAAAGVGDV